MSTDPIFQATVYDGETREWHDVNADDLYRPHDGEIDPERRAVKKKDKFYCTDCRKKGRSVRLNFMSAAKRTTTIQSLDRHTSEPVKELTKTFTFPKHFVRHEDAPPHVCDNAARYAAIRSVATRLNATEVGDGQFIWPISLHGSRIHHQAEAVQGDMRSTRRFKGLDMGGINTAVDFQKFMAGFQGDHILLNEQRFHDGYGLRRYDEVVFEDPASLYDYASSKRGRDESKLAIIVMQPNRFYKALQQRDDYLSLSDYRRPWIMRNNEKIAQVDLTLRAMNKHSYDAAFRASAKHGLNPDGKIVLLAEVYADADAPGKIIAEIFSDDQAAPNGPAIAMVPQVDAKGQMGLAL